MFEEYRTQLAERGLKEVDDAYRDAAALLQYPVPAASADTQIGQVVAVGVPVGQHSPFARRVSRQCRPLGRCLYSADTAATAHSVNPRKLLILLVSRQGLEPRTRRLRVSVEGLARVCPRLPEIL